MPPPRLRRVPSRPRTLRHRRLPPRRVRLELVHELHPPRPAPPPALQSRPLDGHRRNRRTVADRSRDVTGGDSGGSKGHQPERKTARNWPWIQLISHGMLDVVRVACTLSSWTTRPFTWFSRS